MTNTQLLFKKAKIYIFFILEIHTYKNCRVLQYKNIGYFYYYFFMIHSYIKYANEHYKNKY